MMRARTRRTPAPPTVAALAAGLLLAGCATPPAGDAARTVTIQRTTYGVPHISAPDLGTLAYGIGHAYAQDNLCQTADALVTARGERARFFGGGTASGLLARRTLPNELIDTFVAAHMDDAALERAWATQASADARAMAQGYVDGWNRWLADHGAQAPAACRGQPWLRPMTIADYRRLTEVTMAQAGLMALADAVVGARPPQGTAAAPRAVGLADAAAAMREAGVLDSPLGSNAWAFGAETSANGRGLLLGNPHFPWVGPNRFWQMRLTVPGRLDAMGASIGHFPAISIGFNRDVAWSNTVSTGTRFTLHELTLVPGDPTSYVVDGRPEKMTAKTVRVAVRQPDGTLAEKTQTLWRTRFGPVVVIPRAGLTWSAQRAYALQDDNSGQARALDTYLAQNRARSAGDLRAALRTIGTPWVNVVAADRHGDVLYADVSTVPDVDAAHLQRCAPSPPAAALRTAAGLVVLDGSKSACDWRRDATSAQPGAIPFERMPSALRRDWVQNSNDSFVYTHPAQRFEGISPLVGTAALTRPRTRASWLEIPELLAEGKATPQALQQRLFEDRNLIARFVLPDLLAACAQAPTPETRDACAALRGWDGRNGPDARGAHLFREFWRTARAIPGVWREPFDAQRPALTPAGLKMSDATVAAAVWKALGDAVTAVRGAGFALDAPLSSVLHAVTAPASGPGRIGLHGGDEYVGVLNNIGQVVEGPIGPRGIAIDYGTSYVQTVTFDERGPVAWAILAYGQSTDPASPHATDQTRLFAERRWTRLPFHADEVAAQRLGDALVLRRP